MTSASPPPHPSTSAPHPDASYQHLSDVDHCIPPSAASPTLALGRARSGSRTYSEVQEDERREREGSREREQKWAETERALEGRIANGGQPEQGNGEMSETELKAEMETLLLLRRQSMSQPASIDPDLPGTAPPTSAAPPLPKQRPQLSLTITPPPGTTANGPISPTAPSPAETGTLIRRKSVSTGRLPSEHPLPLPPLPVSPISPHALTSPYAPSESAQSAQSNFWLPASLHPELAPQEFKAFIREQTTPEALQRRSSLSVGAGGGRGGTVKRRVSTLRGEYKPSANDGVGETPSAQKSTLKRTTSDGGRRGSRSSVLNFEELTIRDLQRLEELAAKAETEGQGDAEGEGERLGRVLRRSLSLNPHRVAAAAAAAGLTFPGTPSSTSSTIPEVEEGTDEAPIIVPPPGQILRRNARTRIRKGSVGEYAANRAAGGSRFGGPRRTASGSGSSEGHGVQLTATGQALAAGDDDAVSVGDVSFESGESEDVRTVSVESVESSTSSPVALADEGYPPSLPSPPSSDNQHIEVAQVERPPILSPIPQLALHIPVEDEPFVQDEDLAPTPRPLSPPTPARESSPPLPPSLPSPPQQPEQFSRHAVNPASAEYDWSTHNLQFQQHHQQPPPPPPEPQYTVHPSHSLRQPFADVPPPQAVLVPTLPEKKTPAPAPPPPRPRVESPKPPPEKEKKKSGWARLGLGKEKDEDKKKKGKGKEKEKAHERASSDKSDTASMSEKERDKESSSSSSGFFGGLFGRKRAESEPSPPPAPTPPVQQEARMPPPPPTASGALLPNGRYANYYRLPIHVERAVYRLSHIKLANPRRPLYEQVLISNLMFWYLGLIQKPVQPPPAAQPVPIPGMRQQQQQQQQQQQHHSNGPVSSFSPESSPSPPRSASPPHEKKRGGLSKPNHRGSGGGGNGGRTAEMPMRTPSYEVQNQQLAEEQRYMQNQHQQLSQSHPQPSSGAGSYAPPSSSHSADGHSSRSTDRTSAPAQLYPSSRTPTNSLEDHSGEGNDLDEDDDDRPLSQLPHHTQRAPSPPPSDQQAPYRESYPQHTRPAPASSYKPGGFQVTSRAPPRLVRTDSGNDAVVSSLHLHPSPPLASNSSSSDGNHAAPPTSPPHHQRNLSAVSDKSFDASEIYDAYAPGSPTVSVASIAGETSPPPGTKTALAPAIEVAPPSSSGGGGGGKPPLLGTVAPRGSSLKALVGAKKAFSSTAAASSDGAHGGKVGR